MVKNLIGIFVIIMLLATTCIAGCSPSEGYRATEYLNIQTSNPQERILTIEKFSGQRTEEWEFSEAPRINVNCKLEKGSIAIALYDPADRLIFERELPTAGGLGKALHGQFNSGIYKLNINSKNARNVEINVVFSDHDEIYAPTQAEIDMLLNKIEELNTRLAVYEPPPPMNYIEPFEKKRFVETEVDILLLPVEGAAAMRTIQKNTVVEVNDKVSAYNQEEWLYVTIPVYDTPSNVKGWMREEDTVLYTIDKQPYVQSDIRILKGTPVFNTYDFSLINRSKEKELASDTRGRIHDKKDGYAIIDCAGGMTIIVEEKYLIYPSVEE